MSAAEFYLTIGLWGAGAIALAVAVLYFLRPRTRAHFPGGARRYLLAVSVQMAALLGPIPIVLLVLLQSPLQQELQVIAAVMVGLGVYFVVRAAPGTGPLLKDLHRARVQAAADRFGPRT